MLPPSGVGRKLTQVCGLAVQDRDDRGCVCSPVAERGPRVRYTLEHGRSLTEVCLRVLERLAGMPEHVGSTDIVPGVHQGPALAVRVRALVHPGCCKDEVHVGSRDRLHEREIRCVGRVVDLAGQIPAERETIPRFVQVLLDLPDLARAPGLAPRRIAGCIEGICLGSGPTPRRDRDARSRDGGGERGRGRHGGAGQRQVALRKRHLHARRIVECGDVSIIVPDIRTQSPVQVGCGVEARARMNVHSCMSRENKRRKDKSVFVTLVLDPPSREIDRRLARILQNDELAIKVEASYLDRGCPCPDDEEKQGQEPADEQRPTQYHDGQSIAKYLLLLICSARTHHHSHPGSFSKWIFPHQRFNAFIACRSDFRRSTP